MCIQHTVPHMVLFPLGFVAAPSRAGETHVPGCRPRASLWANPQTCRTQWNRPSERLVGKGHEPNQKINFSHLTQQVRSASPRPSWRRQERASACGHTAGSGPAEAHLVPGVSFAASRVQLGREMSAEQMDRCSVSVN